MTKTLSRRCLPISSSPWCPIIVEYHPTIAHPQTLSLDYFKISIKIYSENRNAVKRVVKRF